MGWAENIVDKEKMLVTSIFSFTHNVFKSLLFQDYQKSGSCSKEFNYTLFHPIPVRMKVENTGNGCWALADQHSTVAPMGKQNMATDSGRGKFS